MKVHPYIATLLAAAVVLFAESAAAQNQAEVDQRRATDDHYRRLAEEEAAARESERSERYSTSGPRVVQPNANHGAIAFYEKGDGEWGYIVASGYISPTSAEVQMMLQCERRQVTCQGTQVLSNQWLAVARRTDISHFAWGRGQTREEAGARAVEQCRTEGAGGFSCTLLEVFDINPHRRGNAHLRHSVTQR